MSEVRTRFAPSPTGYLHVGGARTALFNYLYARAQGGKFILRIEDTDQERSTEESYHQVLDSLKWLNLFWDEGPEIGGDYGPYRQSERLEIYIKHAHELVDRKKAYRCFCTAEELEAKKAQREAMGLPPVYDGKCRNLSDEEIQNKISQGMGHTIRFRCPSGEVVVDDMVQGQVRFDTSLIGDFIIVKSDGFPSYNYAVVVDDYLMKISHVIRGVGHLSNTPRQIMIYNAFGWPEPAWAHVSEIVGSDHKKLSKRHGATAITAFRDLGYQSKAFNNYMALLGWSPPDGKEFMSLATLESVFDAARCSKSPAMFDVFDLSKAQDIEFAKLNSHQLEKFLFAKSKLNWLSNQHIRSTDDDEYIREILPFVKAVAAVPDSEIDTGNQRLRSILLSLRVYLDYYQQIERYIGDFYAPFDAKNVDNAARQFMSEDFFVVVAETFSRLINTDKESFSASQIKARMDDTGKESGQKGKNLFMSLRIATTGRMEGLELPVYLELLGYDRVRERLNATIALAQELRSK